MNGALTIQVVKDSTPPGHVEATAPADAGGYRLKKSAVAQANQLAQYTSFWHHPNGKCLADAGWTKTPPPDSGSSTSGSTPAAGSTDPTGAFISGTYDDGSSTSGGGTSTTTTTTTTTYQGTEVSATYTFDNNGATQVLRRKSDGVVITSTLSPFGTTNKASVQIGAVAKLGRLGWRELVR